MEHARENEQIRESIERWIGYLWEKTDFTTTLFRSIIGYAIIAADFDGNVIAYNEGARLIFGYSPEEIIGGENIEMLFPKEEIASGRLERISEKLIQEGRFAYEGSMVRKSGEIFPAQILCTLTRDTEERVIGFVGIVEDISERKRAEAAIRGLNESLERKAAELEAANNELEAFSYSVSHDLRAPLRGIEGFSRMLVTSYSGSLDEAGKDYLRRVCEATERMGQLIDDLLSLSRITRKELRLRDVDLSELVRAICDELQRSQPDRRASIAIESGIKVKGDPGLLRIMLDNLLGNAWKFTSTRDRAEIEFGRAGDNEGAGATYFVRDNGVGFDMTCAENIFKPFRRLHGMTEFPGTGIGLAIAQRIVLRHQGQIRVEGAEDKGATFLFTLG